MQAQYSSHLRYPSADPYGFHAKRAQTHGLAVRKWLGVTVGIAALAAAMAGGAQAIANQLTQGDHLRKEFAVAAHSVGSSHAGNEALIHAVQISEQARKLTGSASASGMYQPSPRSQLAQAASRNTVEIDDKGAVREKVVLPVQNAQAITLAMANAVDTTPATAKRPVGVIGQVGMSDGVVLDVLQQADGSVRYVAKIQAE